VLSRIQITRAPLTRLLILFAIICAGAINSLAQTASLVAGGSGYFGVVTGGTEVTLSMGDCQSNIDDGTFYGLLTVSVDGYQNGVDVGTGAQDSNQVSTGSTGFVPSGTYTVTGYYSGYSGMDSNGNACGVGPITATGTAVVPQAATSTSVTAPASTPIQSGQVISIPVVVIPEQAQPPLTGNAILYYGSRALSIMSVTSQNGEYGTTVDAIATITASTEGVSPGSYTAYVGYSGDTNYAASSSPPFTVNIVAAQQSSTTALYVTPNPVLVGETTTLNITVTPSGNVTPSGKVTLLANSMSIGSVTLNPSTGTANLSVPAKISPGTYSVQALYGGDAFNLPSTSAPVSVTVASQTQTSTSLGISPTPLVRGETAQLTTSVVPQIGAVAPAGSVTITANGVTIASLHLRGGSATSQISTAPYSPGTYSIVATYSGSSTDQPSASAPVTLTIAAETPTATAVTVTPNTLVEGQTAQLTTTVTPQVGSVPPTGSVTISANGHALTSLPLQSGSATISVSTASYPPGTYSVVANYLGDATDESSQSAPQAVVIQPSITVTLTASPNPVMMGSVTTLNATVISSSHVPVTSGTVAFSYSGNSLGSATLNSSGLAQLPISTSGLATGTYVIEADFTGNSNNPSAIGTVNLVVQ